MRADGHIRLAGARRIGYDDAMTRLRSARLAFLALAAAMLLLPPPVRAQESEDVPRLVVVCSWDGLRPDAIEKAPAPRLMKMIEEGAYCPTAQTVFPSATLPGHTSMLTGLPFEKHRVLWNSWVPALKIPFPTFLDVAADAGLEAGLAAGKEKFWHFVKGHSLRTYIGKKPGGEGSWGARNLVEPVLEYARSRRPQVVFVHFRDPDSAGHKYGWMSEEQMAAIRECDESLGRLLDGLDDIPEYRERITVIVTSDHGGHRKTHGGTSRVDMTIPWLAWGFGVAGGTRIQSKVTTYDTAATALYLLGVDVPADWSGRPVFSAFFAGKGR